jgi:hypothetical protein
MRRLTPENENFVSGWDMEKLIRLKLSIDTEFSDSCTQASWLRRPSNKDPESWELQREYSRKLHWQFEID